MEYPHLMNENNGDAWMDISFSHDSNNSHRTEEERGGGGREGAGRSRASGDAAFKHDSLDEHQDNMRLPSPPMAGIGKNILLLKSPSGGGGGRDFTAAGMTSKLEEEDDEEDDDDIRLDKSFSSHSHTNSLSPSHPHTGSLSGKEERERERGGAGQELYHPHHLARSSSDSQHSQSHLSGDNLLPYSSFSEF